MELLRTTFKDFYEAEDSKIIIFGCSAHARRFIGNTYLENRTAFFIDNNKQLQNTVIGIHDKQIPIYSPEHLKDIDAREHILVIGSLLSSDEIASQLERSGYEGSVVSLHDLMDIHYKTIDFYYTDISEINADEKQKKLLEKLKYIIGYGTDRAINCAPKFTIHVTERCTLNCKYCRALTPYIKDKTDTPIDDVKKQADILINNIDYINGIELIGGETLLYPHLAEAINHIASHDNVGFVRITTNCTVLPDSGTLAALKNEKVILQLSDYGMLSKTAQLVELLEQNNIRFRILQYTAWEDCGTGEFNGKTVEEMKEKYKRCVPRGFGPSWSCPVFDNKLWVCPRSPRLYKMGMDLPLDYQEISESDTPETIKKKVEYIYSRDYTLACNYCEQGEPQVKKVQPAIQLCKDYFRSDYTLVDRREYNDLLALKEKYEKTD